MIFDNDLLRTQQSLTSYQCHINDCRKLELSPNAAAFVTSLQLCFKLPEDCEAAGGILKITPELEHLELSIDESFKELATDTEIEVMSSAIMALLVPKHAIAPHYRKLKSLRLDSVMPGFNEIAVQVFKNLKYLHLRQCWGLEHFLQKLELMCLGLDSFCLDSEGLAMSSELYTGLEWFLRSLSSPRTISLNIGPSFVFDFLKWSCFHAHASMLKLLRVRYCRVLSPATSTAQNALDFRTLCETASQLEQFAISGVEIYDDGKQLEFLDFLDCLRPLRSFKTLKLTVESKYAYTGTLTTNAFQLGHLVKRPADKVFSTLASTCPHFVALVIEAKCVPETQESGRLRGFQAFAFMKSKQTDLYGHTSVVGMAIEPHMVKHHELFAEILEPERFPFD